MHNSSKYLSSVYTLVYNKAQRCTDLERTHSPEIAGSSSAPAIEEAHSPSDHALFLCPGHGRTRNDYGTYTDRVPEERGTLSRQPKARNVTTARFMCVPQRSEERTRGSANRQDVGVATQAARRESAECRRPEGESCPSAGRHQKRHAGRKASAEHLRCRRASLKPPIASQRGCFHQ